MPEMALISRLRAGVGIGLRGVPRVLVQTPALEGSWALSGEGAGLVSELQGLGGWRGPSGSLP